MAAGYGDAGGRVVGDAGGTPSHIIAPAVHLTKDMIEADFRARLNAEDQMSWARTLTARPHHAGSEQGRINVSLIADLFREWGYAVEVETFDIRSR